MLDSTIVTARPVRWSSVPSALDFPEPARSVGSQAKSMVLLRMIQGPGPLAANRNDQPLALSTILFSKTPKGQLMLMAAADALMKRQLRTVMGARPPRSSRSEEHTSELQSLR